MSINRNDNAELLQLRGMEAFREARWDEAVAALSALRDLDPSDHEVSRLLAEAQLKLEISRANVPSGALPPGTRRVLNRAVVAALAVLVAVTSVGTYLLWPRTVVTVAPVDGMPAAMAPVATSAPSETSVPATSPVVPAAMAAPSTPSVTGDPEQPGSLLVRMAEGQALTRTTRNIEIILDASGSMRAELDGNIKIDVAHQALATLVQNLPDGTNVALRTYGHRRPDDCSDQELVQPLAPLDRATLIGQINAIRPVPNGRTPMAASLAAVAETLQSAQGDTLVVLVSDGDETCEGDPAAAALALREQFPNVRVSVIGFNIEEQKRRERLQAIAVNGAGGYHDAADSAQLETALQQVVALTYRVLDTAGVEQYSGPIGSPAPLPAGNYKVEIGDQAALTLTEVAVKPGLETVVQLRTAGETMQAELLPAP